ncbi:MAG: hypothetical protein WC294_10115 [Methanoregula sp.]|jgi:hypothetical protein
MGQKKTAVQVKTIVFTTFRGGIFLDEGTTLKEKIEKNVKFGVQMGMPEDMARHMCETILPNLKR